MYKVAIGGFVHETNTYATEAMGKTDLSTMAITRGEEMIKKYKGTNAWGGFYDAALDNGWEIKPTAFFLMKDSFGLVDADAYAQAKQEILQGITDALPLDAVFIANHGAGVVEGTADLEGDLVSAVRELVGPEVKVIGTLDLHGKCTDLSAASFDFVNACLLYPHTDLGERSRVAASMLPELVSGRLKPTLYCERIPLVFSVNPTEPGTIASEILEQAQVISAREGVIDCSVLHGFPYQDSPYAGMTVMVTTDDNELLAKKYARELAAWIWQNRHRTAFQGLSVDQALERAANLLKKQGRQFARPEPVDNESVSFGFLPDKDISGPVVICDYGDNHGSGATGDTTHLLRAMIEAGMEQACVLTIRDANSVQQAMKAGVGATIRVTLGGKMDRLTSGDPIEADAYVKSISDGKFTGRGLDAGMAWDMGPSVRLIIGGIDVVVISHGIQTFDDSLGRLHGIDARDYRVVVVKSANHFRAFFRSLACEILVCDAPGLGAGDVTLFKHTQMDIPLYPHQPDATYPVS